jgi:hypothetical protein
MSQTHGNYAISIGDSMNNTQAPTQDQINAANLAELARLRAENEALRNAMPKAKTDGGFKVTDKGAISFYHGSRFPVTLYLSQWERLIGSIDHLKGFIEANREKLAVKPSKVKDESLQDDVQVA